MTRLPALRFAMVAALVLAVPCQAAWVEDVARMLNLLKTPAAQRDGAGAPPTGDVMMVPVTGGAPRALSSGGGFRSPIVLPDGAVLALRGDDLVRIPSSDGSPVVVRPLPGAAKLIGVDRTAPDRVAFLTGTGSNSVLAILSLANGTVTVQKHDPQSASDRRLLNHLRGDDRDYEGTLLYLRSESRETVGGQSEWTEVYVKLGDAPTRKISECNGQACTQPSLSPDAKQVVYIRSER